MMHECSKVAPALSIRQPENTTGRRATLRISANPAVSFHSTKPNPKRFNRRGRREARRNNEKKWFPSEKTLRSFANPVVEPVRAGFVIRFLELWVNPKPLVQSIRQPINCNRQTRGLCTYHNQRQTVEQNQCI